MDLIKFVETISGYNNVLTNTWRYIINDIKEDNGYVICVEFVFYTNNRMYSLFKINIRISHELCDKLTDSLFNHYIQTRLNEYVLAGMLKYTKEEISDTYFNQNHILDIYINE